MARFNLTAPGLANTTGRTGFEIGSVSALIGKAGMAELADAADSKSADRKVVGVRPPLPAPKDHQSNNHKIKDLGLHSLPYP